MAKATYRFTSHCESRNKDGERVQHKVGSTIQLTPTPAKDYEGVVQKVAADDAATNDDPDAGGGEDPNAGGGAGGGEQ